MTGSSDEPTCLATRPAYDVWSTTYDDDPNGLIMPERGFATPRLGPQPDQRILDADRGTGDHLMHPAGYGLPRLADQPRDEGSGQRTDEPSKGVEEHVMDGGGTIDWQHPLGQFDRERYGECKGRDPYDRS
jgi:hypothetical protein